jgi:mannose/cellobiose epimerase-like protein (N-acyl-D-glucosamine 2-epimerase family)
VQISDHFTEGIVPFWTERGVDKEFGGYLTNYDEAGEWMLGDTDKYIVTQPRMIWDFSLFHQRFPADPRYEQAARQDADFFIEHYWDRQRGGWFWKVQRDRALIDAGKVVYGRSFAIYALAKYYLATGVAWSTTAIYSISSSAAVWMQPEDVIMKTLSLTGSCRNRVSMAATANL